MPTSESQLETLDLILKDLGSVWAMDPDLALTDSNSSVNGYELCQHSYVSVENVILRAMEAFKLPISTDTIQGNREWSPVLSAT